MHKLVKKIVAALAISLGLLVVGELLYVLVVIPMVRIKTILVHSDLSINKETLLNLAGIVEPVLFFRVEEQSMVDSLRMHPEIVSATVEKEFPATLHIRVYGRMPIAYLLVEGSDVLFLDAEGVMYSPALHRSVENLPVISLQNYQSPQETSVADRVTSFVEVLGKLHRQYPESYASISEVLFVSESDIYVYMLREFLPIRISSSVDVLTMHTVLRQTQQLYGSIDPRQYNEVDARGSHAVVRGKQL